MCAREREKGRERERARARASVQLLALTCVCVFGARYTTYQEAPLEAESMEAESMHNLPTCFTSKNIYNY